MKCWKVLLLTGLATAAAHATIIRNYSAAANDLYLEAAGFPPGPAGASVTLNPTLLQSLVPPSLDCDFSGVGWSPTTLQWATMLTPLHFVTATHYYPASGSLYFVNQAGILKSYTIDAAFYNSGRTYYHDPDSGGDYVSDLIVGRLTSPIPSTDLVTIYPVLAYPNLDDYLDRDLVFVGKVGGDGSGVPPPIRPAAGINTLDFHEAVDLRDDDGNPLTKDPDTVCYGMIYDTAPGDTYATGGDSGGPSFFLHNNQLALAGTHSAAGTATIDGITYQVSVDAFLGHYLGQVQGIVNADGYSLTLVPEPAAAAWAAALVCLAGLVCRLRRSKTERRID
ncbi:MAG TPA: hypothetical protein PKM73_07975 [Verrucomicrobiota bacterium]|nr:hypothetical protein [Verrucomicrobiota bacterium]HNU51769.1 hypothetical protein [Verrucomicrobiota bacterium]